MGPVSPRSAVRAGLIGGAVTVFVALVGLLARFSSLELVGEEVTFGRVLLAAPARVAAFVVTRPRVVAGERRGSTPGQAVAAGAFTGLVSGGVLAVAMAWVEWFGVQRIREIFITVSPDLIEFLTFGQGVGAGVVILIVIGLLSGALGGLLRWIDPRVRGPIVVAIGATLLMGLLQRIIPIALDELDVERDWLYLRSGGLTVTGGGLVLVVSFALSWLWRRSGQATRERLRSSAQEQPAVRAGILLIVLAIVAILPLLVGSAITQVLGTVMIFLLLGLGLNIVVGYAGLLDLGYVAFYAFGAYALALFTGANLNTTTGAAEPAFSMDVSFYVAIWLVAGLAAGVGVLIGAPVLRLRGDYLAIVTLGLGEIVSTLTRSTWLQPLVGGPQGVRGVTKGEIGDFSFDTPREFYYLVLAFVLLAMFVSWRLSSSRVGRAWTAMREDEQVADAMGISTTKYKLLAFAMGGAIGSLGGALFAVQIGSLTPASFEIIVSITALAVVILGGLGSLPGVAVGALVLIGLPGLLREFEEYRLLIYGGALVAIMVLRPQGLVPNVRRSRELVEEERTQDSWAQELADREESYSSAVAGGNLGAGSTEDLE
ncbi:MAG: branched-chain amino acid ABC transporter permease [Actinomycetota bacterium]